MTESDRAILDVVLRNDLTAFTQRCFQTVVPGQRFLPNWHIEAIAHQLERCRRREIRRLIVTNNKYRMVELYFLKLFLQELNQQPHNGLS